MGYSNSTLVTRVLAQALTSKTPDTIDELGDLMNIGNTLDSNNVSTAVVNTYIADADADINSTIRMLYAVPLKPKADMEMVLLSNAAAAQRAVEVAEYSILVPGDTLIVTDGTNRETVEVASISGTTVTMTANLLHSYSGSVTRLVRVKYPDPIPYISSRIAAGNIYDKYFAAQSDKNESNYGKYLRSLAYKKLQNILQGISPLDGVLRIGHITVNPTTIKQYRVDNGNDLFKLDDPGGR